MSSIEITQAVWTAEEKVAEVYRATHDNRLPDTLFWDLVDRHYLEAVETGHLARFVDFHGPRVTLWEEQNHAPVAPATWPVVPIEPIAPSAPITMAMGPMHPGSPGPGYGSGAVPEPSSIVLLGLGASMTWAWILRRVRRHKRCYVISDYLERRQTRRFAPSCSEVETELEPRRLMAAGPGGGSSTIAPVGAPIPLAPLAVVGQPVITGSFPDTMTFEVRTIGLGASGLSTLKVDVNVYDADNGKFLQTLTGQCFVSGSGAETTYGKLPLKNFGLGNYTFVVSAYDGSSPDPVISTSTPMMIHIAPRVTGSGIIVIALSSTPPTDGSA